MKIRKGSYTWLMLDFVREFAEGEKEFWEFDEFYDGYAVHYYPKMEREYPLLAELFAATVDSSIDYARDHKLSEDDYRDLVAESYNELIGGKPVYIL